MGDIVAFDLAARWRGGRSGASEQPHQPSRYAL